MLVKGQLTHYDRELAPNDVQVGSIPRLSLAPSISPTFDFFLRLYFLRLSYVL